MSQTKALICIIAIAFALIVAMILTSSFISKRIPEFWLMVGFVVFGCMSITCFVATMLSATSDN